MSRRNRNRRNDLSMAEIRRVGFDFIEFLRESNKFSITQRDELHRIYNEEFRERGPGNDPQFCRLLYVMRNSNKARVTRNRQVYFNNNVRVVEDQWSRPNNRQQNSNAVPLINQRPLLNPYVRNAPSPPPGPDSGVRGRRKLAREILKKIDNERSEFISDKFGIQISSENEMVDGRLSYYVDRADIFEWKLYVTNTGLEIMHFTYYSPLHWIQCFSFEDVRRVTRSNSLSLSPGEKYEVTVKFHSKDVGVYRATVAFEFKQNMQGSRPFHIVRFIEAEYNTQLARELAAVAPYTPSTLNRIIDENYNVDEGEPPEGLAIQRLKMEVSLGMYNCPDNIDELTNFLKNPLCYRAHLQEMKALLKSELEFHNYTERFQLLLHLEESQMKVDIKRYDKNNVPMKRDERNKKLLVLEVPGVSENRPSVLRGDHLLLTKSDELQQQMHVTKYKGYVHRVELDKLKLGFSSRFLATFIDKMTFRVEFTFNRLPLRLQHRAVQLAVQNNLKEVLFPTESTKPVSKPSQLSSYFDTKLNDEQHTAVCNIVAGVSKPAPYLVFGPPGTGKTVTMVEAIKQVEKFGPNVHILACAPSNDATDQLCEKVLQHVDKHKVYRMYASSRNPELVPENLKHVSNLIGESFEFPAKEELMKYKVLVTTVVTAGRLVSGGIPISHFTHIFLDEAGHAVECEAIIAIAGLLRAETGQLVLAGDPKQLGPILRSPFAIKYGLGLSLLERLMTKNSLYQKTETGFNNNYVTKLIRNYRSHRSILKIPNEMFYDGELQPCADEFSTNFYCNWERLPKKNFPLIFHGVKGKDEREENSPSFFNTSEITIVVDYLKELLLTQAKKGVAKISPKDIGVIAPYRKQVEKLRKAIRTCDRELKQCTGIEYLKVGSVEEFQGQERRVIIVSTVRSSSEFFGIDSQFNIGFLKNEKRFNVALTRARSLLIVVGNPIILSTDPSWCRFIDYCTDEGGCRGFERSSVEDEEEVIDRLTALNIHTEVETEESSIQQYVNPEWRSEQ